MGETTQALGQAFLEGLWGLFSIEVPGFTFTIGQMWLGVAICSVSLLVMRMFFGIGGKGVGSRTSSTNNPKISEERKRDEY